VEPLTRLAFFSFVLQALLVQPVPQGPGRERPAPVVFESGPATLTLVGDSVEKRLVSLRFSSLLKLAVAVEGDERLAVESFKPELDEKAWKVYRQAPAQTVRLAAGRTRSRSRTRWSKELELEPVVPGKLPLPSITLRYRDGRSRAVQEAKWSNIEVEVVGPDDADRKEVRGDLPIEKLPEKTPWWRPLPYVAAAVVGLGLGIFGVSLWLRRSRPAVLIPPHRRALEELDRLEKSEPPAGHAPDWYHTRLSAIVRRYLEERFTLRASRQTTQEFFQEVQQRPELGESQQLLRDLFARCDLAKFTGLSPRNAPAENAEVTEMARTLVQQTTPP
jgi:hypothetical protein